MRILSDAQDGIAAACEVIKQGGVVAHATETCYGFACDMTNVWAVEKLFRIKKRSFDQPVSALFFSIEEAKRWVQWSEIAEDLAEKYLPGPLTIILPLVGALHATPIQDLGTIGLRISSHPVAHMLASTFGNPLSTTSANLHGLPEAYSVGDIISQFEDEDMQPDLILDSGVIPEAHPSTIVEIRGDSMTIVRQGSVRIV